MYELLKVLPEWFDSCPYLTQSDGSWIMQYNNKKDQKETEIWKDL